MNCFDYHNLKNKNCKNKECRYWMTYQESQNCCINAAKKDSKLTLENIGSIFKLTRMRICQIEKIAVKKIKEKLQKNSSL